MREAAQNSNYFRYMLKFFMDANSTTQQQLAYVVGVQRQTISQYVNGLSFPSQSALVAIADYFHVSLDLLLGRDSFSKSIIDSGFSELPPSFIQYLSLLGRDKDRAKIVSDIVLSESFNDYVSFIQSKDQHNQNVESVPTATQ